jgi:hypothetical protein
LARKSTVADKIEFYFPVCQLTRQIGKYYSECHDSSARVHKPGPPDVIVVESIDVPEPGGHEVLVSVRAAGVGPWDALVRTGNSGFPCDVPIALTLRQYRS